MRGRSTAMLAGFLFLLGAGQVVAFVAIWWFFVHTERGQLLDTIALSGNYIGQDRIDELVYGVLNAISVLSLAVAAGVIAFIALIRRRRALALMTIVLIVGANATTQLVKYGTDRPDLGIDEQRAAVGNSLPSGHTTVAASLVAALILVLPPRMRAWGGLLGAGYAALAGVATLSADWHRPSDAVAALLIVGAWTAAASLVLVLVQRSDDVARTEQAHPAVATALAVGGVALLAAAAFALRLTDQVILTPPEQLGRRRLFAAYAGGAAGIAGTAALVMAMILATVHRVVPQRGARPLTAGPTPLAAHPGRASRD